MAGMAKRRMMQRLAQWHIWLGWLVGVPLLLWTVSGLVMALRPIDEVRGDTLIAAPPPVDPAEIVFPDIGEPVRQVVLVQQADGPSWIVTAATGQRWRYSAIHGTATPPVIEDEARRIAEASYAGEARLEGVAYFPADVAPTELGAEVASWRAHYDDGTNLYIDSMTGEVLAARTGKWRLYDLMWGLHIMDLQTRQNASHPILILFAALAVGGVTLGCVLLFRRRKARIRT